MSLRRPFFTYTIAIRLHCSVGCKSKSNVVAGGLLFAVNGMPYPGEAEPVQGFVMNFSTGEIIDTFIPVRKVEYCTECMVHINMNMRMVVTPYFYNFHEAVTENKMLGNFRYSKEILHNDLIKTLEFWVLVSTCDIHLKVTLPSR